MFQTHSKSAHDVDVSDVGFYDHISYPLDMHCFYAKACYVGPKLTDFPTPRVMMTPSLPLLDRVLSGKEKGVSIHTIQVLFPTDTCSSSGGDYDIERVMRVTRLKASGRGKPRYFVESTSGVLLDGDVNGLWATYERTVLFDCYPRSLAGEDEEYKNWGTTADVRTDIFLRVLVLCTLDEITTKQWWDRSHSGLGDKMPRELGTLAEYQKLSELVGELESTLKG
ncbi:hypothetical protein [Pseudomonas viridiflava]|uniref:hypothetical protein n=1 Tax=Pseudomonas viridiflava TaxID=33069 RepID=UPI000F02F383|nr:hypothetical protein [Pseudomonas viridiflava]